VGPLARDLGARRPQLSRAGAAAVGFKLSVAPDDGWTTAVYEEESILRASLV
jgi:hypothetical protein